MNFTDALKETLHNRLLDELYLLTEIEYNDEVLSIEDKERYLYIWELLNKEGVDIPFGVNI